LRFPRSVFSAPTGAPRRGTRRRSARANARDDARRARGPRTTRALIRPHRSHHTRARSVWRVRMTVAGPVNRRGEKHRMPRANGGARVLQFNTRAAV
jgi:hypothetical protein